MFGITVTLTTASTAYRLLTLLEAVDVSVPGECSQLTLQADAANTADSTIAVGDSSISTSRCGYQLAVGDAKVYDARGSRFAGGGIPLNELYVLGSANSLKLNVEVLP